MMLGHGVTISAIADKSSVYNRGRAIGENFGQAIFMDEGWRQRIEQRALQDGRSLRDISLAAGLSHGYPHGILRDGKEPTLDRFVKICDALGLSVSYAMLGIEVSPTVEKIIRAVQDDPARQSALLALLSDS